MPSYVMQPLPSGIHGRVALRFGGAAPLDGLGRLRGDYRYRIPAVGVISDRVTFKATPTAPESPFAMGREGWSDAGGNYTATGLEPGVEYIAVGIDPYRNHKATGAGPVVATEAAP